MSRVAATLHTEGGIDMKQWTLVVITGVLGLTVAACATAPPPPPPPPPVPVEPIVPPGMVTMIEYDAKAKALVDASERLETLNNDIDEQRRRLTTVCVDYPDHVVCQPQTEASFARKAFCEDANFTEHVDEIVKSCHQGQCKEVDEARLLSRTQYMTLIQRLPHKLVLFKSANARLDRNDKKMLQQYIETIGAEGGFVIIVGRASKEGPWRANLRYALDRADTTRSYLVDELGLDANRVGYITYGHEKMYLTDLDAERLSDKKLTPRQANRSALVFAYPCYGDE
ncbi:MAG: outer membrane protein OmpA-like peptidoglycan-associated protein [Myxococcota bacterium]|jgi:outer membrane protein OmpA-like peptidoglycan-associated protein